MRTLIGRRRLQGQANALAALGAACLALVIAAGTARAEDNQNVDPSGNKMCPLKLSDGKTYWYREGESYKLHRADGSTQTFRCSNGNWVQVKVMQPQPTNTGTSGGGVLTPAGPRS